MAASSRGSSVRLLPTSPLSSPMSHRPPSPSKKESSSISHFTPSTPPPSGNIDLDMIVPVDDGPPSRARSLSKSNIPSSSRMTPSSPPPPTSSPFLDRKKKLKSEKSRKDGKSLLVKNKSFYKNNKRGTLLFSDPSVSTVESSTNNTNTDSSIPLPEGQLTAGDVEELVNYVVSLASRPPKHRLIGAFFCSFEQFGVDKEAFFDCLISFKIKEEALARESGREGEDGRDEVVFTIFKEWMGVSGRKFIRETDQKFIRYMLSKISNDPPLLKIVDKLFETSISPTLSTPLSPPTASNSPSVIPTLRTPPFRAAGARTRTSCSPPPSRSPGHSPAPPRFASPPPTSAPFLSSRDVPCFCYQASCPVCSSTSSNSHSTSSIPTFSPSTPSLPPPSSSSTSSLLPSSVLASANQGGTMVFSQGSSPQLNTSSSVTAISPKPSPNLTTCFCFREDCRSCLGTPAIFPTSLDGGVFSSSSPLDSNSGFSSSSMPSSTTISPSFSAIGDPNSPTSPILSLSPTETSPPTSPSLKGARLTTSEEPTTTTSSTMIPAPTPASSLTTSSTTNSTTSLTSTTTTTSTMTTTTTTSTATNDSSVPQKDAGELRSCLRKATDLFSLFSTSLFELGGVKEIAERVTYLMWKSYQLVTPYELFDGCWQGKKRQKEAPNIHKLGVIFNHLSSLCAVAILSTQEAELRLQILTKVIELGYRLKKLKNFEGMGAVGGVFGAASIQRLKTLFSSLPKKTLAKKKEIDKLLNPARNYEELEKQIANARAEGFPCIPLIAPRLRNLRYLYDSQTKIEDDAMNFPFLMKIGTHIYDTLCKKGRGYNLPDPEQNGDPLNDVLDSNLIIDTDQMEDALYERSVSLYKPNKGGFASPPTSPPVSPPTSPPTSPPISPPISPSVSPNFGSAPLSSPNYKAAFSHHATFSPSSRQASFSPPPVKSSFSPPINSNDLDEILDEMRSPFSLSHFSPTTSSSPVFSASSKGDDQLHQPPKTTMTEERAHLPSVVMQMLDCSPPSSYRSPGPVSPVNMSSTDLEFHQKRKRKSFLSGPLNQKGK